jgi:hypothetical protein
MSVLGDIGQSIDDLVAAFKKHNLQPPKAIVVHPRTRQRISSDIRNNYPLADPSFTPAGEETALVVIHGVQIWPDQDMAFWQTVSRAQESAKKEE